MGAKMILFVEDEAQQLKYMRRLLEGQGYHVLGARDGIEAVEVHRRHSKEIDLVVLDLKLPKLNGWDAFQQMKKKDPQVKALIATAHVTSEVRSAIAKGEALDLFLKPYPVDVFLAKISEVIGKPT